MASRKLLRHGLYTALTRPSPGCKVFLPRGRRLEVSACRLVHQFPSPEIKTEKAARTFIVTLDDRSRRLLLQEMANFEAEKAQSSGHHFDAWKWTHDTPLDAPVPYAPSEPPSPPVQQDEEDKVLMTRSELWNVFLFNCIPFVGFGILDNLIMIVAGEYIDAYLGAVLGISTMAAAGLGNLVSDVAGVGTAGYVEAWTSKIGVTVPVLSAEQATQSSTRWSIALGRAIGISVGCLIGMFPLLFFKGRPPEKDAAQSQPQEASTSQPPASLPAST